MTTRAPTQVVTELKAALDGRLEPQQSLTKVEQTEDGEAQFCVEYDGAERRFNATELLVMLFAQLKRQAASSCNIVDVDAWHPLTAIALPVDASAATRVAVRTAAQAAGLDARLCSDALALGYAYAISHGVQGACNMLEAPPSTDDADESVRRVLLVDVGDAGVTVASVDVCADASDAAKLTVQLVAAERIAAGAGARLTSQLERLAREQFAAKHGAEWTAKATARLRREAQAKKAILSTVDSTELRLECLVGDADLSVKLTRAQLLDNARDELTELAAAVRRVLPTAADAKRPVRAVELVGGGSRVPGEPLGA